MRDKTMEYALEVEMYGFERHRPADVAQTIRNLNTAKILSERTMNALYERVNQLENTLAEVTAERDSLRKGMKVSDLKSTSCWLLEEIGDRNS